MKRRACGERSPKSAGNRASWVQMPHLSTGIRDRAHGPPETAPARRTQAWIDLREELSIIVPKSDSQERLENGMRMQATTYLLVCDQHRTFTALNRFLPRQHRFEGEYSLLHNRHAGDHYFLSKFLLAHREHPVRLVGSDGDSYYEVLHAYQRFMEDDIPKYVEQCQLAEQEAENRLLAERHAGQLQLFVVKHWIQQEWEEVRQATAHSDLETYVLLGKDWAFRRSVDAINRVAGQVRGREG